MIWNNFLFVVFGAIVGSFLHVCIVRLPQNESILRPRSHCRNCKKKLPWYDLIPILSYLWLRGRCRFCKAQFSIEHFLVELFTALIALWVFSTFGTTPLGLTYFAFVSSLIVVTCIDLHHRIIPDSISLGGTALGLVLSFFVLPITPLESFLGAFIGGGFLLLLAWGYFKLTGREGMGGGDIKLTAMFGAFLGFQSVFLILFVASILGAVWGAGLMLFQRKDLQYAVPFGPFLALGAILTLFYGDFLLRFLGY
ncbi:MAG: hypothetical protein A3B70_02825 [Deltaproteobacteria bacterium RIFCSPHIGHO2_02_FULL_40_11]|nr:MAG: hypothetical protein A3B70_02825 [Deltaproteobacteria bacterium RIFCSPHIGHO2_02_FULL_40_11]